MGGGPRHAVVEAKLPVVQVEIRPGRTIAVHHHRPSSQAAPKPRNGHGAGNGNGQSQARGQRQGNGQGQGQGNGQGGQGGQQRRASNTQAAQPAHKAQPAKQPFNGLFAKAAALLGGRKA